MVSIWSVSIQPKRNLEPFNSWWLVHQQDQGYISKESTWLKKMFTKMEFIWLEMSQLDLKILLPLLPKSKFWDQEFIKKEFI